VGEAWRTVLKADPLPWLLEEETPAIRHLALRALLDEPEDAPAVRRARSSAMRTGPIATILANQHPQGWWVKPGAGYGPKYTGTVWSMIVLDQMGALGSDPGIRRACRYVLEHSLAVSGGFGASGAVGERPPPPSSVYHCLNGNLLRALIGFGWLDDARVRGAIGWQASAITGDGDIRFFRSGTSGPGFRCAVNEHEPCGWGAIKALRGLARIPSRRRTARVRAALAQGVDFLLSHDPARADYPMGWGNTQPSRSWFRLGFPSGYVADVLQNLEVLCELGRGRDPRLGNAIDLVLSKQDAHGRWANEYPYRGRLWVDVDEPRSPSKWVTLRACAVLRHALN
jgi:hypothetical protein